MPKDKSGVVYAIPSSCGYVGETVKKNWDVWDDHEGRVLIENFKKTDLIVWYYHLTLPIQTTGKNMSTVAKYVHSQKIVYVRKKITTLCISSGSFQAVPKNLWLRTNLYTCLSAFSLCTWGVGRSFSSRVLQIQVLTPSSGRWTLDKGTTIISHEANIKPK